MVLVFSRISSTNLSGSAKVIEVFIAPGVFSFVEALDGLAGFVPLKIKRHHIQCFIHDTQTFKGRNKKINKERNFPMSQRR